MNRIIQIVFVLLGGFTMGYAVWLFLHAPAVAENLSRPTVGVALIGSALIGSALSYWLLPNKTA
jgi:hypothetical protein